MWKKVISGLVIALFFALSALAADLPSCQCKIASQVPGLKLAIDCVLQEPVSRETLEELAADVYKKRQGKNFQNVFIMWYLPNYKIGQGAWGTTNYKNGQLATEILALQGDK